MKTKLPFALLCLFLVYGELQSQTHTWIGASGDQNWFTAANWDVNTVPDATSEVLIPSGFEVDISDTFASINQLILEEDTVLTLQNILNFSGNFQINLGATLEWKSGTLLGGGILTNRGLINCTEPLEKVLSGIQLNNHHQFIFTNSSFIRLLNDLIITNFEDALFEMKGGGGLFVLNSSAVFNNHGLFKKTSIDGEFGVSYVVCEFNNMGVVETEENQTFLFLSALANLNNFETGIMQGFGVMDITAPFVNVGTIYPGTMGEVGTLSVTNIFATSSQSILEFDINGSEIGDYDTINIVGFPDLQGNLQVKLGYAPQVGDEFTIISANNITSCDFPENLTASFSGMDYLFEVHCNDTTLVLEVVKEVLGIDELISRENIVQVYPNPMLNATTVQIAEEFGDRTNLSIGVYNYLGKEVKRIKVEDSQTRIERGSLSSGLYFIQLLKGDAIVTTTKLLLK